MSYGSMSVHNNAALNILRLSPSVQSYNNNPDQFNITSNDILEAINDTRTGDKDLRDQYGVFYKNEKKNLELAAALAGDTAPIPPDKIKHGAVAELVRNNREKFPPEEIVLETVMKDGEVLKTTIPAAVYFKGEIFEKAVAKKQEAYDEGMAPEPVPDRDVVKMDAMAKVVETLVLDKPEPEVALLEPLEEVEDADKPEDDKKPETFDEEDLAKPYQEH